MNWIEDIRNKPHSYKVRLMWIIIIAVIVILFATWILTSRIGKNYQDASVFIQENVKKVRQEGQELYKENK